MKNALVVAMISMSAGATLAQTSLEVKSAWGADSMLDFFEAHGISKDLKGLYLTGFKTCISSECVQTEAEALRVIAVKYDTNLDVDRTGPAHYRQYAKYQSAIVLLASRVGSEQAKLALLNSIEMNEIQLRNIQDGSLKLEAYAQQRVAEVRTLALRSIGLIGLKDDRVIELLKRVEREGKNPFGIYDMHDGLRAQNAAKRSIKLLGI